MFDFMPIDVPFPVGPIVSLSKAGVLSWMYIQIRRQNPPGDRRLFSCVKTVLVV